MTADRSTPPHVINPPSGKVRTLRCTCGERFRKWFNAGLHAEVFNVKWREETGLSEVSAARLRLARLNPDTHPADLAYLIRQAEQRGSEKDSAD